MFIQSFCSIYHFTTFITFFSFTKYNSTSNIFHVDKLLTLAQAKMLQIQPVLNLSSIETNFFYFWVDLADFFLLQYHGLQIDVSNSKINERLLNKIRLLKKRLLNVIGYLLLLEANGSLLVQD